jgi:predicted phosphatase
MLSTEAANTNFIVSDLTWPVLETTIYHTHILDIKVILHQFSVKKIYPWKFNLEYGGTFTKLFMHVSSRNMFPTTKNLQIRVHVYRPVVETD